MMKEGRISKRDSRNTLMGLESTRIEEILNLPLDDVFVRLGSSQKGLSSQEVKSRLQTYGYNELAKKRRRIGIVEFLFHLRSPLVIILLFAGLVSGLVGQGIDATIIFSIVLLSIVLDVYQESKAEKSAEILKKRVVTTSTVLRDGVKTEVRLSEIVPGDVIYLSAGDIIPADSRIIISKDLFIDQSALTGESFPVEKTPDPLAAVGTAITDWNNCLFLGTPVVSGTATAVVVRTGSLTEYGKIAKSLVTREPDTEFEKGLRRFGFLLTEITFILVIFVFFINAFFRRGALESLLFAVALAVGLTPELLPMIMSVNLSRGALAMSKKDVIVKRLASIQNLGNMDTLCTDKTGTLTENKITLLLYVDADGKNKEKILLYSQLNSFFSTGLRNPLDEAILNYRKIDVSDYQKIDEVPFDFTRRRVSIVVEDRGQPLLISKGAPEEISKVCSYYELDDKIEDLSGELKNKITQEYLDLSSQGFRVLSVSYKKVEQSKPVYSVKDEREMVFLGFVAFMDPPKETAKESLRFLKEASIELNIFLNASFP